jgi:predicted GNAT superfamily acetyltransferase
MRERGIVIRPFATLEEMRPCIALQQAVWQYADLDVVPHAIFVVAYETGGQVLGAFDELDPIGFILAFPALRSGRPFLHSHLLAVLPKYQSRGIGRRLKLAQRDDALRRGIDLIEWTFDPLQPKNAHLNIARLGAIARRYLPDHYGRTSSPLHGGLPTDRLVAEWWVRSRRVEKLLQGEPESHNGTHERIALPLAVRDICRTEPERAHQIQLQFRRQFEQSVAKGYAATRFELNEDHGSYLLEPYED